MGIVQYLAKQNQFLELSVRSLGFEQCVGIPNESKRDDDV